MLREKNLKMSGGTGQYYKYTTVLKMYINISCLPLAIYTNASYCLRMPSVQIFFNLQVRKYFWLLEHCYEVYIKNELEFK